MYTDRYDVASVAVNRVRGKNIFKLVFPDRHFHARYAFKQLIATKIIWKSRQELGTMNKVHLQEGVLT